jgi:hypothetical protein
MPIELGLAGKLVASAAAAAGRQIAVTSPQPLARHLDMRYCQPCPAIFLIFPLFFFGQTLVSLQAAITPR